MASFTIKNIPEDLHEILKKNASLHHRSMNNEIIYVLEQGLGYNTRDKQKLLREAAGIREKTSAYLTENVLEELKNQDRP
ncbi:MAG: FitA-like ribbon-helix-helix domain-containing protein [Spirochaetia bacterium]